MVDSPRVAVTDGGDQLLEVTTAEILAEASEFGDFVEELSSFDELHREEDLCLRGHDLVEPDDVGVR